MSFFFNDTATTEIYTLSLHDALPIYMEGPDRQRELHGGEPDRAGAQHRRGDDGGRERRPVEEDHRRREGRDPGAEVDRKSTRLNSSHANISYAVFCLKKKKQST